MKLFQLALFILCFTPPCMSQWSQLNDFEGESRLGLMSFELDGRLHVLGGTRETSSGYIAFDDLWQYEQETDTWTSLQDIPKGNIYGGFAFVIDETVYVGCGGNESGIFSDETWAFDHTNGWTQVADFPGTARVYPIGLSSNQKGYVGCGYSGAYESDFWEYDPVNDQWTAVADYPGGGKVGLACFGFTSSAYVGLGDDGSFFYNDFYEFSPANGTWTAVPNFTGPNRSFSGITTANNKGYVIGGEASGGGFTNEFWEFDPEAGVWARLSDFAGDARRYGALGFVDGSFFYGLGQLSLDDSDTAPDFWELDTDTTDSANAIVDVSQTNRSLQVYPNPFRNEITVKHSNTTSNNATTIRVYNLKMQLIYEGLDSRLNTTAWNAEPYIIQVITDKETFVSTAIKLH